MVVCAVIPLIVFGVSLRFGLIIWGAAYLSLLISVILVYAALPLSWFLYRVIRRGDIPEDADIRFIDAGCPAVLFLLMLMLLIPVFQRAEWKRRYDAAKSPQEKAALKRELQHNKK